MREGSRHLECEGLKGGQFWGEAEGSSVSRLEGASSVNQPRGSGRTSDQVGFPEEPGINKEKERAHALRQRIRRGYLKGKSRHRWRKYDYVGGKQAVTDHIRRREREPGTDDRQTGRGQRGDTEAILGLPVSSRGEHQ